MKNGKFRRRGVATKTFAVILALMLVVGISVGATIAWLTAKTDPVVNTFTVGDINITLEETTEDYKIVPGVDIDKDPVVTVLADSEACWLFVEIDEANWPTATEEDGTTRKVEYEVADGWTELEDGVYYREVDASEVDQEFAVLKDNQVTVSGTLTKAEVEAITTNPTLTFTAYAIQKEGFASAEAAWDEVTK